MNGDPALLDEVTALVEWPVAISGSFDERFLEVPAEALISSMQDHQKFFPVLEGSGDSNISNRFVAIANLESRDPGAVRDGYERVIRPRLADARFFLEQDSRQPFADLVDGLDQVVFQQSIGTIGDKSQRISSLSGKIADLVGEDSEAAARAGLLSKCDLVHRQVGG